MRGQRGTGLISQHRARSDCAPCGRRGPRVSRTGAHGTVWVLLALTDVPWQHRAQASGAAKTARTVLVSMQEYRAPDAILSLRAHLPSRTSLRPICSRCLDLGDKTMPVSGAARLPETARPQFLEAPG